MGLKITVTVEGENGKDKFKFGGERYETGDNPRYYVHDFTRGLEVITADLTRLLACLTKGSQLP